MLARGAGERMAKPTGVVSFVSPFSQKQENDKKEIKFNVFL